MPIAGLYVPALAKLNERVKAHTSEAGGKSLAYCETDIVPFCDRVNKFWSENFGTDTVSEKMTNENCGTIRAVFKDNVVLQAMFEEAMENCLRKDQSGVIKRVTTYRDKKQSPLILALHFVLTFLKGRFIETGTGTNKELLHQSLQCSDKCIEYLCFRPGSDEYNREMARHSATIDGEDMDRKVLCALFITMTNLAIYTSSATDDEIDRVLGLAKRAESTGDKDPVPHEAAGGACGSSSTKRKDVGQSDSGGSSSRASQKQKKFEDRGPTSTNGTGNESLLNELSRTFITSICKDPGNTQGKWNFDTIETLRSIAGTCKRTPMRLKYALTFLDEFQGHDHRNNETIFDLVKQTLDAITDGRKSDEEAKDTMKTAIETLKAHAALFSED
jgi:hypothetical protein